MPARQERDNGCGRLTIGLTVIDVLGQSRFNSKDASAYALTLCEGGWQQTRSKCFPGLSQGPSMFPACNKAVTIKLPICKRLNRLWSQALILYVAPGARLARAPQPLQHARRPSRSNCPYGAHQGQRDSAAQVPSSASCEPQASAQTQVLATLPPGHRMATVTAQPSPGCAHPNTACHIGFLLSLAVATRWQEHMHVSQLHGRLQ